MPTVLVIDDNDVAQRVVTHILRRGFHEPHCVSSGPEGIEAARSSRFDLILMDLQMPGMDGLAATKEIRKLPGYQSVPIVAFTANSAPEYRAACREAGLQGFVAKPVQSEELLTVVTRLLE